MKEEKIKIQAKKWAEMYINSPAEFIADYQTAVDIGRYEPNELLIIVNLAHVYENCIKQDIDRQEAIEKQAYLLEVYRDCITKQMSVADALSRAIPA